MRKEIKALDEFETFAESGSWASAFGRFKGLIADPELHFTPDERRTLCDIMFHTVHDYVNIVKRLEK